MPGAPSSFPVPANLTFDPTGLAGYTKLIAEIRTEYAGTPIGGSESIVAPLVRAPLA